MNDYRLVFPDEAAWWAAADAQGWVQYEYEPQPPVQPGQEPPAPVVKSKTLYAPNIDFDIIGVMYEEQPIPDPENPPPPVLMPGWHLNVRFREDVLPPEMASNVVLPANPRRTFAGGWFQGVIETAEA
jgi:hypothetical protein